MATREDKISEILFPYIYMYIYFLLLLNILFPLYFNKMSKMHFVVKNIEKNQVFST